jgi:hypothetical protein
MRMGLAQRAARTGRSTQATLDCGRVLRPLMRPLSALVLLPLAACVAPASPMPLAASGPAEVLVGGAAFMADLQPVAGGAEITVSRDTAFDLDEGLLAKAVAAQLCADRSRTLDPRALGAFVSGTWVFDGGCA